MAVPSPSPLRRGLRRLRRGVLTWRRPLSALLAAVAVLTGIRAATAPPEPQATVVVAARDLPGGSPLTADDLFRRDLPADAVPEGATDDPRPLVGRTLAAPLRRGELVTDLRVVGPGILEGYPSLVATPVRVTDAGVVRMLRVGDHIDLIATDPADGRARVVAGRAPVVALPRTRAADDGLAGGALVVVAVSRTTALDLAGSAAADLLSVLLSD